MNINDIEKCLNNPKQSLVVTPKTKWSWGVAHKIISKEIISVIHFNGDVWEHNINEVNFEIVNHG